MLIATAAGVTTPIMQLLKANVRDPESCEGDLLGQIAATKAGERRIVELCREHGKEVFTATLSRLHDLSEIEMREALRELPDGVYEGEDYLDDGSVNDEPARIHVKITIAGDEATFDLSGELRPGLEFLQHHAVHCALRGGICGAHHERARNAAKCRGLATAHDHHAPGIESGAGVDGGRCGWKSRNLNAHRRCDLPSDAGRHSGAPVRRRDDDRQCAVLRRAAVGRFLADAV